MKRLGIWLFAVSATVLLAGSASAKMIKCRLRYDLQGWSFVYMTSKGSGSITCSNGQSANVRIVTHGGGATVGTTRVVDGRGVFSEVASIEELYGSYAEAHVHAGAGGSADARVMLKGNVNLSLAGSGQGINLGLGFGAFTIRP